MLIPESLWFEIALVSMIYALGNIILGHFEEQTPKTRRVGKYLMTLVLVCVLSFYLGRTTAMVLLGCSLLIPIYIHAYYLPKKKGIHGLTGAPKSKYYDLRGWDKNIFD